MKSIKELKEEKRLNKIKKIIDEMLTDGLANKKAVVWESKFQKAVEDLEKLISQSIKKRDEELKKFLKQLKTHDKDLNTEPTYNDMEVQFIANKLIDLILNKISNKQDKPI